MLKHIGLLAVIQKWLLRLRKIKFVFLHGVLLGGRSMILDFAPILTKGIFLVPRVFIGYYWA